MVNSYKQNLLAIFAPKVVPITIKTKDGETELYVRELSAHQVFELQDKQRKAKEKGEEDQKRFILMLVAETLCDEKGASIMTYEEAANLLDMKVEAFNVLAETVAQTVGLTKPEEKEKGGEAKNP